MTTALKSEALPLLGLFSEALGRTVALESVKISLNASRLSSRDIRRLCATCREPNGLPWALLARRLPRMIVGSCTRSLRSTKEMS